MLSSSNKDQIGATKTMVFHLENGKSVEKTVQATADIDDLCEEISNEHGYCVLSIDS